MGYCAGNIYDDFRPVLGYSSSEGARQVCAEFISIGGNILIVNPNMPFFKLARKALTGEIARKLGRSEDEVKEAFDKEDGK